MQQEVKEDILSIIDGVIVTLKIPEQKDIQELKEFSNHTIHDASIYQDEYSVEIAVLVYSLYKLLERGCQCSSGQYGSIVKNFEKARSALASDDMKAYQKSIKSVFDIVRTLDERAKMFVEEVIDKAKITKGSKLFAHGLSLQTAAHVMGVNQWELANYVGKTNILNDSMGGVTQRRRFGVAWELFSK